MRLEEEREEAGKLRGVVPRKCARVMEVLAKAVAVVCAADREERARASVEVPMDQSSEGEAEEEWDSGEGEEGEGSEAEVIAAQGVVAAAASDEVPMDHGSEEEDEACGGEVRGAKGAGTERAGVTGVRAGSVGRKRGRRECSEEERGVDREGEAVKAGEAVTDATALERANAEMSAGIEERWEEGKRRAWEALERERRRARVWGYRSGTGTAQVWVSTAVRGSGEERDMSGDARTAGQCRAKERLDQVEGMYQNRGRR